MYDTYMIQYESKQTKEHMQQDFNNWYDSLLITEPLQYVYLMYDADNVLLYVGITDNIKRRLRGHYKDKHWIDDVVRVSYETYDTREDAKFMERRFICLYRPKYNIHYNGPIIHADASTTMY